MRDRIVSSVATVSLGLIALLAGATVGWSHGGNVDPDQVHACIGNVTKVVRIVGVSGTCISQPKALAETAMHWPASIPPGPPANGGGLKVVDSMGTVVGNLISFNQVAVDVGGGVLVDLGVTHFSIFQLGGVFFYYELALCAGPAYVRIIDVPQIGMSDSVNPNLVYYGDPAQVQTKTFVSAGVAGVFCNPDNLTVDDGAPVLTFDLSTLGLVPPFKTTK